MIIANGEMNNQQSSSEEHKAVKRVFFHGRPNSSRMSLSTISTPSELYTPSPTPDPPPKRRTPPPPSTYHSYKKSATVRAPSPVKVNEENSF